jgi:multidrug transporter EmrE-like cation transporter
MKFVAWIALAVAVFANVATNISLKLAMRSLGQAPVDRLVVRLIFQPWIWIGVGAGCVLLASYLLAIRDVGLGFSYAVVTSLTLVLVTVAAAWLFEERLSAMVISGVLLVVLGIAILTGAQLMK